MVIKIYKRLVCPAYSQKISSELSINHGQPLTSHNSNAYNESHDDSFPLPSWWAHCFWFPNPHGAVGIWIEMISRWWIHICVFIFNPNPTWGNARKKRKKNTGNFPIDKFHGKLGELMWTMPFTKPWSAAVSRPLAPFRSCRPSRRAETRWSRSGSGERLEANGRQSGFWEMDDDGIFLLNVSKIGKNMCVCL